MLNKISLLLAIATMNAHANTIYKCQDGDNVIFSQIPCETDKIEDVQVDYSTTQNNVVFKSNSTSLSQNDTDPMLYSLVKKKERSLAKIEQLTQKYNADIEKIKTKGLDAGVNRAGSSYLVLLTKQIQEVKTKYEKNLQEEQQTLKEIEKKMSEAH